jgi:hypothetical protein
MCAFVMVKLDTSVGLAHLLGDVQPLVDLLMQQHEGDGQYGEERVEREYLLDIVHQVLLGEVEDLTSSHVLVGQLDGPVVLL